MQYPCQRPCEENVNHSDERQCLDGPSNVTISPQTQIYTINESIGSIGPVTCKAHGCKSRCVVKWSGPKVTGDASSVLNLQNLDRNKTGNYFCTASNNAWSKTSTNISVIVNYGPNKVNISPLSMNYNVQEITGIVGPIYCSADCKPECAVTWSGPYIPDGTTSILNLQNINRNQAGKYQCNATNIIDGPGQVSILPNRLTYTVTETIGNVGPITCTVDCNPICLVTWTGPNIQDDAMSVLHLQKIDRNQAGNYLCTASNSYGNRISSTISVIVICEYYLNFNIISCNLV
ncbi:unnamed protein product [Mytilus coruscus]|uniref:Ig-like domain-containing protein n=1 Tax=Mytilus coruscus TaxID=42192 RepID=A0A6J8APR7_MYTCO|nr:unnamed protein product [Mytilus coruscus]